MITSVPVEAEGNLPENYTDGSEIWWRYKADAEVINSNGFVKRQSLARILDYE